LCHKTKSMARPTLQVKGYTPGDIRSLFRNDERYTIGLRLYAVYQVSLGQSSRNLEELYNTSAKQITNWVHRFEKEGIEGLKDKEGRGRTSRLNDEQEEEIKKTLMTELPSDYGFNTATWTGPILIEWIKTHYKIIYKKAQIYNILKRLGFSYQKGKGIFPEADKNKQEAFKEGLKKTARRKT
jgi:transposase